MRETCERIAESNVFGNFIIGVIVAAGVVVGFETYPEIVARHGKLLHLLNTVILWIFVVEIVIKMAAFGKRPWLYFKDPWNVFDFAIVAVCFMPVNAQYVAVLRLARILRVMRLVTAIPKLQILVGALLKSIPSMGYVSILLLLLFYIYAVMGTFWFGKNDPVHFGSLPVSMLSLFRVVTLEDWTDVMYIQMLGSDVYPYANPQGLPTEPAAAPIFGALFFVSFVLLGTMVILNLFIGVIMNGMDEVREEEARKALAEARRQAPVALAEELEYMTRELDDLQKHMGMLRQRLAEELGERAVMVQPRGAPDPEDETS
jgi:voltage-gated sodium channel